MARPGVLFGVCGVPANSGPAGCVRVRWWGSVAGFARLLRGGLRTVFGCF